MTIVLGRLCPSQILYCSEMGHVPTEHLKPPADDLDLALIKRLREDGWSAWPRRVVTATTHRPWAVLRGEGATATAGEGCSLWLNQFLFMGKKKIPAGKNAFPGNLFPQPYFKTPNKRASVVPPVLVNETEMITALDVSLRELQ